MSKLGCSVIVAIVAVLVPASPARASTPAAVSSPQQTWMPDVAERVASLRERTERATEESKARSADEAQQRQWWHRIALAPHADSRP
jgi:hypothetical protein